MFYDNRFFNNKEANEIEKMLGVNLIKKNKSLVLGSLSLIISFFLLPFCLLLTVGNDLLGSISGEYSNLFIIVILSICAVMIALSIILGSFSIAHYKKTKSNGTSGIGSALSILSFIVCAICITINIIQFII